MPDEPLDGVVAFEVEESAGVAAVVGAVVAVVVAAVVASDAGVEPVEYRSAVSLPALESEVESVSESVLVAVAESVLVLVSVSTPVLVLVETVSVAAVA